MAVNNSIAAKKLPDDRTVEYQVGDESVKLSPTIVRSFLTNGNGQVTDQEVTMFINLCRYQHLNPFLREAYLIKFGNQPATIVTGKDAIMKRAMRNPAYAGQQAGVVILHPESGELENRMGSLVMKGEQLVGGWAKVYVKGYQVPIETAVSFDEYVGLKNDGTINGQWAKKPATMIRKVALTQALREAFPEDLGGLYAPEEMGDAAATIDADPQQVAPIVIDEQQQPPQPIAEPQEQPLMPEQQTLEDLANF